MSFPCVLSSMSTMAELGWDKSSTRPAGPVGRPGAGPSMNSTTDVNFTGVSCSRDLQSQCLILFCSRRKMIYFENTFQPCDCRLIILLQWKRCVITPYVIEIWCIFSQFCKWVRWLTCASFFVGTPLTICANTLHLTSRISNAFCVQLGLGLGFLLLHGFLLAPVC